MYLHRGAAIRILQHPASHEAKSRLLPAVDVDSPHLPWELRTFGDKSVCSTCYGATIDLGRAAIKGMPADEPNRACSSCRALQEPKSRQRLVRCVGTGRRAGPYLCQFRAGSPWKSRVVP